MIVYHLSKAKWAVDNITRKRLKIAEIHDLNDPFELAAPDLETKKQRNEFRGWRREMAKRFGVLCFSRNWENPVLWSHYADKHKGIALGFEVASGKLMDVIYTSTRLPRDSIRELIGNNAIKFAEKLLLMKYTDWAYEDEVRIFADLNEKDPDTEKYYVPFSAELELREIIVGPLCDIRAHEIQKIIDDLTLKVTLTKARLAFKSFRVIKNEKGFSA